MSYSRGTPNFNLPQTQGSDKRDWSDTNQAFLAVDTALKTAGDNATSAGSAASTAQTRADSAYSLASTANTAAGNAATAAATAGELAQTAKNRADSAYTAVTGLSKTGAGTPVQLTVNSIYTTTSDGYLIIGSGSSVGDVTMVEIIGSNNVSVQTVFQVTPVVSNGSQTAVYIKSGMKLKLNKLDGIGYASFVPLI